MKEPKQPESPFLPNEICEDWVGPPDSVSKIRPIRQHIPTNETALEKILREKQASVLAWNHLYWKKHNKAFKQERRRFVELRTRPGAEAVTDDQMADFYREFMERNREKHRRYNLQWYGHNFRLLGLAGLVAPLRLLRAVRLLR
ncbi:cytochrome c oxidase assembly factor 8-like [Pollicipes pollicipes]|uniref:cytochrome c oxidase assembly factor 8-like n=1 Tax=Pollicipes pollicipes TaxID=41117 RepID=UPI001884D0FC|nr:cytochrome c oxidase assembly factor 8-like [Pollicipes pollicipes]XP_037072654.1 cytochrome c oxidase assembly factor 8-like [Pollicipes pollicipes]XP_037072655.1 cytochrome c oxidase assembly factor 8-like [Pollicipes pollicipes]